MKKIIFLVLSFVFFQNCQSVYSAVVPMSSWIKDQFYEIEWCSPHSVELSNFVWTSNCTTWYFHNVWWKATIVYDWTQFDIWSVGSNVSWLNLTRSPNNINSIWSAVVDFFTTNIINIEAEWQMKIKLFLLDYADNLVFYELNYNIDKTAPQLYINNTNWITENTIHTYYDWPDWKINFTKSIEKYDSLNSTSNWDRYNELYFITNYSWDIPVVTNNHSRVWIHTFYFSRDWDLFWINKTSSDNIWWIISNLTSGVSSKIELLTENWTYIKDISNFSSLSTSDLTNTNNSQAFYKLRYH